MSLPFDLYLAPIEQGSRPRREREEEAVRALVSNVFGEGTRRLHDVAGAPYIAGSDAAQGKYISISHSRLTAALAVSDKRIGIDIEENRAQLLRVAPRILTEEELRYYSIRKFGLAEAWTLKEALFKASRSLCDAEIDFRKQLHLPLSPDATASVSDSIGNIVSIFTTTAAILPDGQILAAVIQCSE